MCIVGNLLVFLRVLATRHLLLLLLSTLQPPPFSAFLCLLSLLNPQKTPLPSLALLLLRCPDTLTTFRGCGPCSRLFFLSRATATRRTLNLSVHLSTSLSFSVHGSLYLDLSLTLGLSVHLSLSLSKRKPFFSRPSSFSWPRSRSLLSSFTRTARLVLLFFLFLSAFFL